MSKKLHSSERWKRRVTAAQQRETRKAERRQRGAGKGTRPVSLRPPRGQRTLTPPTTLSLLRNPEATIRFLRDLTHAIPKYRVFIEFADVDRITPDAPLALLGTLRKFGRRNVRGSVPRDPTARAILEQSGFFEHVRHGISIQGDCQGLMIKFSGKRVDPELARRLIHRGMELLFGTAQDSEPSYSVIVEGMENTIAHAHRLPNERGLIALDTESWWASVFVDRERQRICFALLDVGVGILRSARVKALRRLSLVWRKSPDAQLLLDILGGKLPSRTELPNRGKGLPEIKRLSDLGEILELTLVTNAVHAALGEGQTVTLSESFSGTLLYWEISK